jgi:hypothetical protein
MFMKIQHISMDVKKSELVQSMLFVGENSLQILAEINVLFLPNS